MKFHKFLLTIFFFSFYLSTICVPFDLASAGINEWTPIGPEGGFVNAIAVDPQNPSNVYAGTSGSGLFKSTDGGLTWSAINTGLTNTYVRALAIDPQNPNRVYAGIDAGAYKSTDGGTNWSSVNLPFTLPYTSVGSFAINPLDPSVIYAGTGSGVFKSVDGGANWFASGLSGTGVTIAINPLNPNILYAGTPGGIYKSTDAGTTWNAHNSDLTRRPIEVLAVDPQDPNIIYAGTWGGVLKSTDAWYHWESINSGLTNPYVIALCIDPQNPSTIYAGTNEGLFKTIDGGTNWVSINAGLVSITVSALALNPQSTNTVFAGTQGSGVFKSTDGGAYWNLTNKGLINNAVLTLVFDPMDPNIIYAGTYGGGAFRSTNRGSDWTAISAGLSSLRVEGLAISPSAPDSLYAMTYGGGIFKSSNGGGNWTAVNSGLPNLAVDALIVDPQDSNIVYAGMEGYGIYKSTDGGANWNGINAGLKTATALVFNPKDPNTIYAGTDYDGIYKSTNGGSTWRAINVGLGSLSISALAIDSQNPDIIYAGIIDSGSPGYAGKYDVISINLYDYGTIYKTTDGGESWNPVNFRLRDTYIAVLAIDPLNLSIVYAGTDYSGVFKSINGGTYWNAINEGLTNLSVETLVTDPLDPKVLYVGTYQGVFRIEQVISNDGQITIIFPNGGESLTAGSIQTIRWRYSGNPGSLVKIELLKGGVANSIISSSAPIGSGGSGSYDWSIPSDQEPGSNYIIRLTSTNDSAYTNTSDNNFTIAAPPTISLLSPNGGETWTAGSTQTIRWSYGGNPGSFAKIELLNGRGADNIISSSASIGSGGTGSYDWSIPSTQTLGSDYQIRITSTSNASYTDTSVSNFAIAAPPLAAITILSPNGAEAWTTSSTQKIRWTYTGNLGPYVKIELLKGGAVSRVIRSIAWKGTGGSGSVNWRVRASQTPGADYRIRVTSTTNGAFNDTSDSDFTIAAPTITVGSPNNGETWPVGSTETIRWNYTGNPGTYVKIELLKGGVLNRTIASSAWKGTGGSGSRNWTIPVNQTPGADYRIRVTSTTYGGCTYTSDSDFTIVAPTVTVVSPNGGETLTAGATQTIRWTYTGNPGSYVKIELLKGGVVNRTIAWSALKGSGGNGSRSWKIPLNQAPGTDYSIRVTSTSNNSYSDTSDSNFIISK